jgi:signal transduction histidine kinase/ligand-binding sensor domain-containing protein
MSSKILAFVVAASLAGVPAAVAQDFPPTLGDYRITSWMGGDGITLGEVRALAQDADGYLWLATERGLVRFDGFRFATSGIVAGSTPLPMATTRAVYVGRDGSLWVGYGEGHGVYRVLHGQVQAIHLQGQIEGFVNVITEDRSGTLWIGHSEGLHRLRGDRWERVPLPTVAQPAVRDLEEDRDGRMWVASVGGLYREARTGGFERASQGEPSRGISEDGQGRLWTTDDVGGFRPAGDVAPGRLFEARGMDLFHDRRGNLWVTTIGQGIWHVRYDAGGGAPLVRRATVQNGLASDENSVIFEDRDGNIWVASLQGLNRLSPFKVNALPDIGVVRTLAFGPDKTAWAATGAGLVALSDVTAESTGTTRPVSKVAISALHTSSDGTVWVATQTGLHRLVNSRLERVRAEGPRLTRITSMTSDRRGTLWISDSAHGLVRFADGRLEVAAAPARPLFTYVDRADRVWLALENGTVSVLDPDGRARHYGREQGLAHDTISAIHQDLRGDIWVGGNAGLSLLQGERFQTLTSRNGLPGLQGRPSVTGVVDDDSGDLWVAIAYVGFIRLEREEIARGMSDPAFQVHYRVYNSSHGVGYTDSFHNGNTAVRAPDGELWIMTSRGVTVLDPERLRSDASPEPGRPRIEGVTADERFFGAVGAELPPRTSRLRIDYTVVSLSSSERYRFRYRLDGYDTDWIDGTTYRQASYTNLPPGAYRFRLQASSNATTWTDAEVPWSFSIRPTFYQTSWFSALCALASLLAVMGLWQVRVRKVRKEVALVFGERIRVAREIHDTLLQSIVGISLQVDAAARDVRHQPARAEARLTGMQKQIEGSVREARQAIWDLRSPSIEAHGLVGALRATGSRLTAGTVDFALTVTGTPRPCPPHVETQALRIGHEAVLNAVRHAEARQVRIEIGFDDALLRLRVADDGRGFQDPMPASSFLRKHYGLVNMKERAADAGGRCRIESTPGAGVEVIAEFPLTPVAQA